MSFGRVTRHLAGTTLVKDIFEGSFSSDPTRLTNVGGILFFRANNVTSGEELWRSDGTPAGTLLVKDIWGGSSGSAPIHLTNVGSTLFFSAFEASTGMSSGRVMGPPRALSSSRTSGLAAQFLDILLM